MIMLYTVYIPESQNNFNQLPDKGKSRSQASNSTKKRHNGKIEVTSGEEVR